jgi:hypothetical protein
MALRLRADAVGTKPGVNDGQHAIIARLGCMTAPEGGMSQ